MSHYYIIVNINKRQYLTPSAFGESVKWMSILSGYHGTALACLVCNVDAIGNLEPPAGTWAGDTVIVTSDHQYPDANGIETATPEKPNRNLYGLACEEYENISGPSILMLARWRDWILDDLAARAATESDDSGLFDLGNLTDLDRDGRVGAALRRHFGEYWRQRYELYKRDWVD